MSMHSQIDVTTPHIILPCVGVFVLKVLINHSHAFSLVSFRKTQTIRNFNSNFRKQKGTSYTHQRYYKMVSVLIVGATRGLGASLTKQYAAQGFNTVYATSRSDSGSKDFPDSVNWLTNIDLTKSNVGNQLAKQLEGKKPLDIVVSFWD